MTLRIIICFLAASIFLFPASTIAELDNYNYKIIQIAFMNGYSNAMDTDLETITLLKQNQDYLKNYMETAVGEYMQKVIDMNRYGNDSFCRKPNLELTAASRCFQRAWKLPRFHLNRCLMSSPKVSGASV